MLGDQEATGGRERNGGVKRNKSRGSGKVASNEGDATC